MSTAISEPTSTRGADQLAANGHDTFQLVSFRLGNEEYGVDIMHAQEIILIEHITEMPQVPEYVRGLINLRGSIIPIVDLRTRFRLKKGERTEDSRIVILNIQEKTIGIIVDAVHEVLHIQESQVEPAPPGICGIGHQYVRGLVKYKDRLLVLLDIEHLMATETAAPGGS